MSERIELLQVADPIRALLPEPEFTAKIPVRLLSRMLFLDSFEEPSNFRSTWTEKQKMQLMGDLRFRNPKQVARATNLWIWFGSYHSSTRLARCNGKYVQRELYELLRQPLKGKRLTNHLTNHVSDVNPFKSEPGQPGYLNHINMRADPQKYFKDLAKLETEPVDLIKVAECQSKMIDEGYIDMGYKAEELRIFMIDEGFTPPIIEAALKQCGLA